MPIRVPCTVPAVRGCSQRGCLWATSLRKEKWCWGIGSDPVRGEKVCDRPPPGRTLSVCYGTVELDILSSSPFSIKGRHKKVRLKSEHFRWLLFTHYLKNSTPAAAALVRSRGAVAQSGFLSGLGLALGSASALAENDGWIFKGGYGRSFSAISLQHPYPTTSSSLPRQ